MNSEEFSEICPLCGAPMGRTNISGKDAYVYNCKNCGRYRVTRSLESTTLKPNRLDALERARLSYAIARLQASVREYESGKTRSYHAPELDVSNYKRLIEATDLPRPPEQMDMILHWVGNELESPGSTIVLDEATDRAKFGAIDSQTLKFLVDSLEVVGLIEKRSQVTDTHKIRLTAKGWQKFEELERTWTHGSEAFMAMGYDSAIADEAYKVFQRAIVDTGFHLFRLDERPEAGLLDNRMIVAIQNAKFVVADLTSQNRGAYWEAGMAHGMGKRVIYTCEKEAWEDVHFDTNHYQAVIWEKDKLDDAADKFKAAIRATFPYEAKMED